MYRALSAVDLISSGLVTKGEFTSVVAKHGVYLSREDLNKVFRRFGEGENVNYARVSQELGLHKTSFNYMKSNMRYLHRISKLKSLVL